MSLKRMEKNKMTEKNKCEKLEDQFLKPNELEKVETPHKSERPNTNSDKFNKKNKIKREKP